MKKIFVFIGTLLFILSGCQSNEIIQSNEPSNNTRQDNIPKYVQSSEDIVDMHGDITNIDKFLTFLENVNLGVKDKVRVVRYTEEGDPMLHDLEHDGEIILSTTDTRRDTFGSGSINTATCKSIEIKDGERRTDYDLTGCDQTNRDNSILVIWK
ncbi:MULTISPECIES: DUF4362 domain-containing protein [Bacillus]|uniref:DUF4362 domain-containing protein n=1 Tax=Bacillus TaxID=1386 RepID=UPI000BB79693|nr:MULTISPECIES: DUF4362 domain-containing protein [Bacillus]